MSGRTKRFLAPVTAFLSISVMLVFFQNCTVATNFKSAQSDPATKGNGTGYEGKTDFESITEGSTCPDNNPVVHNIQRDEYGRFFLTRANCSTLDPARELDGAQVRIEPLRMEFRHAAIFMGRLFVERPNGNSPPSPGYFGAIEAVCRAENAYAEVQVTIRPSLLSGIAPYGARVVSTYRNLIAAITSPLPSTITGDGMCQPGQTYRSSPILGRFMGPSASSVIFYGDPTANPMGGTNQQPLMIMQAPGAVSGPGGNGSDVIVNTNFFQSLVIPGTFDDETRACESSFNQAQIAKQANAPQGRCFFVDNRQLMVP